jgi:hypothetical protein
VDEKDFGRHGAFSRADAIAHFGRYRVRAALGAGFWSSPWPGVLVESKRAAEPLTLASAALVLAGTGVQLAGPTAAHLHGCLAADPTPVHLMAPYGHWLRSRTGLVVHNGSMVEADLTSVSGLPILDLERTLTDILCWTGAQPTALAVLDEALRRIEPGHREQFRARIEERLAGRRDPRGTRCGRRLLDLATGRAESPAESWLLWRIVDSGFPPPEANWSLAGPDGREIHRLDLAWPDLRIVVEYYGYAVHAVRESEDEVRAESLRRRGWILIEARAGDLADPARLQRELDDAFRRRGVDMSRRSPGALRGRRHREPQQRRAARSA